MYISALQNRWNFGPSKPPHDNSSAFIRYGLVNTQFTKNRPVAFPRDQAVKMQVETRTRRAGSAAIGIFHSMQDAPLADLDLERRSITFV
jgi:hypothetical protein